MPLISFFADPVAYVTAAVEELDPLCFTRPEEPNNLNVDQVHFLQVQRDLRSALLDLRLQFRQMFRLYSPNESNRGAVLVSALLNFQRHDQLLNDSRLREGNPGATRNQLSRWCLAFELRL